MRVNRLHTVTLLGGLLVSGGCVSDLGNVFDREGLEVVSDGGQPTDETETSDGESDAVESDVAEPAPAPTDPGTSDTGDSDVALTDEDPSVGPVSPQTDVTDETDLEPLPDAGPAEAGAPDSGTDSGTDGPGMPVEAGVDSGAEPDECTDPCDCDPEVMAQDSDTDSVPDCVDECPDDPNKSLEGECGCNVVEDAGDDDGDSVINCFDGCIDDAEKDAPGQCGCNVAEDVSDIDDDGVIACLDGCPNDPDKSAPGGCGCGMPDTENASGALLCEVIGGALAHRYSFGGSSSTIADSVGGIDGAAIGAQPSGGQLALAGGSSGQFVNFPNNLLTGLVDATFEVWVTWAGGGVWQRVFDFGSSDAGEDNRGVGTGYLFLTASSDSSVGETGTRAAFLPDNGTQLQVSVVDPLPTGTPVHVAVVFDDSGDELALYVNGSLAASTSITNSLSQASMVNNWLGRSQYVADPGFEGSYDEFRIYSEALGSEALMFSFAAGPGAIYR